MHRWITIAAYGWLVLGGILHIVIDVASQYLRSTRAPGPATTLYYGLNTSYAAGQIFFGLLGLLLVRSSPELVSTWPIVTLSLVASVCWLVIGYAWMEYWEPKAMACVFGSLILAATLTR
ncbi:conserved membrane hypothetical protein [Paraburkholderia caribensis]|nr:conserved membrane hypothetical protein [Paraburkholderia caribensis]